MRVFALSDPHLAFGVEGKEMDRFGANWANHPAKIRRAWLEKIEANDVVLVPGDISWAKRLNQVLPDLRWLHEMPGTKLLLKGNHDFWWSSFGATKKAMPSSLKPIQNDHVRIGKAVFFGARLWDTIEYSASPLVEWDPEKGRLPGPMGETEIQEQEAQYEKELGRLRLSIASIPVDFQGIRIGLSHYPPLSWDLKPSRAHKLFREAGAAHVVFGHLHSIKEEHIGKAYGHCEDIQYHLCSCDYLDFAPKFICEV